MGRQSCTVSVDPEWTPEESRVHPRLEFPDPSLTGTFVGAGYSLPESPTLEVHGFKGSP